LHRKSVTTHCTRATLLCPLNLHSLALPVCAQIITKASFAQIAIAAYSENDDKKLN
jgi:hypothetical protein